MTATHANMESNYHDTMPMSGNYVDPSIAKGRYYAHPPCGEEVCITGISGTYPNSLNVREFKDNLFNKIDMVSDDERRWDHLHFDIPLRSGKIYDVDKFDPGFFGIPYGHVDSMDPKQRLILEKGIECIFDAGIHPAELEGTKTGVFIGAFFDESERKSLYHGVESQKAYILGNMKSMIAHKLSLFLKLKGPSYVADTACSSSLYALENAYKSIRDGVCDMAIVAGSNLCLHPGITVHFTSLGVLSPDGACKSFDESGDGYCRAEAITCLFLQKTKYSRRIYATVLHIKTSNDGFKDLGISYPSSEMQMRLMKEIYEECQLDPSKVCYVEAHGTGTAVGDPVEVAAIDKVFCNNRTEPLLIGAVKSNMGHSEGASGLTALVKCLITMEEGHIPPNIHYNTPRKTIRGLVEGRIKVVVEKTPFPDKNGLVAINNFGFGGANAHVLLEWNSKVKVDGGRPTDDIPRLVCVSGRTSEAISSLLDSISENFDAEYIQLLHEIFRYNIECHNHRGYSIVSKNKQISASCKRYCEVKPKLLMIFSDFGNSWQRFAKHLLTLPIVAKTIQDIHQILIHKGVNILDVLHNSKILPTHPVVNNILGTLSLHIGIIELLKNLKVEPNAIFGPATGAIACAYFDGVLTLQQAVLTALEIANHLKDISRPSATYIVKSFDDEDLRNLPSNVETTWKYCDKEAAISGEAKAVHEFVTFLQKKGVEAFLVGVNDVTIHSENNTRIESTLLQKLKAIVPDRKTKSSLWLSTSDESTTMPENFVGSLYSKGFPANVVASLSSDTICLEIGVEGLSKLLNHGRYRPLEVINFSVEEDKNGLVAFLEIIGNIYERGINPQIQYLYPIVQYPVSRGTPTISDKIKWEHSKSWHVMRYSDTKPIEYGEKTISVCPKEDAWNYVKGHVVDVHVAVLWNFVASEYQIGFNLIGNYAIVVIDRTRYYGRICHSKVVSMQVTEEYNSKSAMDNIIKEKKGSIFLNQNTNFAKFND